MVAKELPHNRATAHDLLDETLEALLSLGHTARDARQKIETVTQDGNKFKSVEELLAEIYRQQRTA